METILLEASAQTHDTYKVSFKLPLSKTLEQFVYCDMEKV